MTTQRFKIKTPLPVLAFLQFLPYPAITAFITFCCFFLTFPLSLHKKGLLHIILCLYIILVAISAYGKIRYYPVTSCYGGKGPSALIPSTLPSNYFWLNQQIRFISGIGKSGLLVVSANETLLKHSHSHFLVYFLRLLSDYMAARDEYLQQKPHDPQSLKYVLSDPLA